MRSDTVAAGEEELMQMETYREFPAFFSSTWNICPLTCDRSVFFADNARREGEAQQISGGGSAGGSAGASSSRVDRDFEI